MTLTYQLFSIAPLLVALLPTSPLLLHLSLSHGLGRCFRTWVLIILLTVCLSSVFYPNKRHPSLNFQKAPWNDFVFYFHSYCSSAEEYSSFSLSYAATALFTSLALNRAKSSIPFSRVKRQLQAWWSAEVEKAVSERRKAFTAAYRSDEDCQAYISASRHALFVIAKAKTEE